MAKLLMFHGRECPHCKVMMPLVEKLEKEMGIVFDKHEVWHDEKNADLMRSYKDMLTPKCGGQLRVPAPSGLVPLTDQGSEFLGGVYPWGDGLLVVSRGVGTSFLPFRLLTRPEATLWRLV